jgi:anti-sigma B factor antagonist
MSTEEFHSMSEDEKKTAWKASGDAAAGLAVVEGEVDFTNSLDVRQWLREFAGASSGELRLDLSGLSYIDSSGLAVLIEVRKMLKAKDRPIRIVAVSSQVKKLLALTQIGELFGV